MTSDGFAVKLKKRLDLAVGSHMLSVILVPHLLDGRSDFHHGPGELIILFSSTISSAKLLLHWGGNL